MFFIGTEPAGVAALKLSSETSQPKDFSLVERKPWSFWIAGEPGGRGPNATACRVNSKAEGPLKGAAARRKRASTASQLTYRRSAESIPAYIASGNGSEAFASDRPIISMASASPTPREMPTSPISISRARSSIFFSLKESGFSFWMITRLLNT